MVIDASVYISALRGGEAVHAKSSAWLARAVTSKEPLAAPAIFLAEVGATLARRSGDTNLAQEVITRLEATGVIVLHPVGPDLARRAAALASQHRLRGCDAIYVALAQQLGETLVTLDEEQLARGTAVVTTVRPQ